MLINVLCPTLEVALAASSFSLLTPKTNACGVTAATTASAAHLVMSSVRRNVYGGIAPWGEMSIHGAKPYFTVAK